MSDKYCQDLLDLIESDLPYKITNKNRFHWGIASLHSCIDIELITRYPEKMWNMAVLANHPNFKDKSSEMMCLIIKTDAFVIDYSYHPFQKCFGEEAYNCNPTIHRIFEYATKHLNKEHHPDRELHDGTLRCMA